MGLTTHLHPMLRLSLCGTVSQLILDAFVALIGTTLPLPLPKNARYFMLMLAVLF